LDEGFGNSIIVVTLVVARCAGPGIDDGMGAVKIHREVTHINGRAHSTCPAMRLKPDQVRPGDIVFKLLDSVIRVVHIHNPEPVTPVGVNNMVKVGSCHIHDHQSIIFLHIHIGAVGGVVPTGKGVGADGVRAVRHNDFVRAGRINVGNHHIVATVKVQIDLTVYKPVRMNNNNFVIIAIRKDNFLSPLQIVGIEITDLQDIMIHEIITEGIQVDAAQ